MNRLVPAVLSLCVLLIAGLALTGCGYEARLKVGAMESVDALPVAFALHKPIFRENSLAVEATSFDTPARLRDALLDGKVDAVITDLFSALLMNEGRESGKIVRVALRPSASRPMFAVLAGPAAPQGLEGARIAHTGGPVARYLVEKLIPAAGIERWSEVEVGSPGTALVMLQRGEVALALLSEPHISMALRSGARVISDDRGITLGQTVVVFGQRMVVTTPAYIRRFLRAYEQSARELNVRPELYGSTLAGLVRAPADIAGTLTVPVFPFPGEVPTESEVEAANAWLAAKGISSAVPYSRAVNGGFLWDPYLFRPAACCGW